MQKTKEKPPQKRYFTVELEAMIPAILKYKVLAESEDEALKIFVKEGQLIERPKLKSLSKIKKIYAKVYEFGTNMLKTGMRY